jgi:hypothetical protein
MIEKEKLVKTVGAKNVSNEPAILLEYSRDMSFVSTIMPEYVVKPNKLVRRDFPITIDNLYQIISQRRR